MVTSELQVVVVVKIKYVVQIMELVKITHMNSPFSRSEVVWFGFFYVQCEDVYTRYIACMARLTIPTHFKSWT